MKILGIDTSCDDTAVALLEIENGELKILSSVVSSQVKLHAKYGGVYPFLAKREHQKNLPAVFKKAVGGKNFDSIAITVGPGLEPCLWQGINFAVDLSQKTKKPLIPVNHIEAHFLANYINQRRQSIKLPAVALVVSGGHTQLIFIKKIGQYKLIGETRDDAAGECLDKAARILGLGYPGGPAVAAEAAKMGGRRVSAHLPRPMIAQKNYDFSFSGLKTAVLYKVRELKSLSRSVKAALCAEVQQAIIDVLIRKTLKASKDFKAKSVILGGGVAANSELRRQFKERIKKEIPDSVLYIPDYGLCTDNAAMIAATAFFHKGNVKKNIKARANLRI